MLITAAVYGGASLATFVLLRERAGPQLGGASVQRVWRRRWRGWPATWRSARAYRDFCWLLACGACYQAGISVVIALAAVYAEQVLGFKQAQTMMLVFLSTSPRRSVLSASATGRTASATSARSA